MPIDPNEILAVIRGTGKKKSNSGIDPELARLRQKVGIPITEEDLSEKERSVLREGIRNSMEIYGLTKQADNLTNALQIQKKGRLANSIGLELDKMRDENQPKSDVIGTEQHTPIDTTSEITIDPATNKPRKNIFKKEKSIKQGEKTDYKIKATDFVPNGVLEFFGGDATKDPSLIEKVYELTPPEARPKVLKDRFNNADELITKIVQETENANIDDNNYFDLLMKGGGRALIQDTFGALGINLPKNEEIRRDIQRQKRDATKSFIEQLPLINPEVTGELAGYLLQLGVISKGVSEPIVNRIIGSKGQYVDDTLKGAENLFAKVNPGIVGRTQSVGADGIKTLLKEGNAPSKIYTTMLDGFTKRFGPKAGEMFQKYAPRMIRDNITFGAPTAIKGLSEVTQGKLEFEDYAKQLLGTSALATAFALNPFNEPLKKTVQKLDDMVSKTKLSGLIQMSKLGVGQEKETAERMLESYLKQNGLTMADAEAIANGKTLKILPESVPQYVSRFTKGLVYDATVPGLASQVPGVLSGDGIDGKQLLHDAVMNTAFRIMHLSGRGEKEATYQKPGFEPKPVPGQLPESKNGEVPIFDPTKGPTAPVFDATKIKPEEIQKIRDLHTLVEEHNKAVDPKIKAEIETKIEMEEVPIEKNIDGDIEIPGLDDAFDMLDLPVAKPSPDKQINGNRENSKLKDAPINYDNLIDKRVKIPYDNGGSNKGSADVIDYGGRKIVVLDINGKNVPFYLSSGLSGKKNVSSGKWYPILGIDTETGWFNKGTEEDINNHYGSKTLKEISQKLDEKLGDLRDVKNIPEVGDDGIHFDVINKDIKPTRNGSYDTLEKVQKNAKELKEYLDKIPVEKPVKTEKDAPVEIDALATKIVNGVKNFTPEELQLQQNESKNLEKAITKAAQKKVTSIESKKLEKIEELNKIKKFGDNVGDAMNNLLDNAKREVVSKGTPENNNTDTAKFLFTPEEQEAIDLMNKHFETEDFKENTNISERIKYEENFLNERKNKVSKKYGLKQEVTTTKAKPLPAPSELPPIDETKVEPEKPITKEKLRELGKKKKEVPAPIVEKQVETEKDAPKVEEILPYDKSTVKIIYGPYEEYYNEKGELTLPPIVEEVETTEKKKKIPVSKKEEQVAKAKEIKKMLDTFRKEMGIKEDVPIRVKDDVEVLLDEIEKASEIEKPALNKKLYELLQEKVGLKDEPPLPAPSELPPIDETKVEPEKPITKEKLRELGKKKKEVPAPIVEKQVEKLVDESKPSETKVSLKEQKVNILEQLDGTKAILDKFVVEPKEPSKRQSLDYKTELEKNSKEIIKELRANGHEVNKDGQFVINIEGDGIFKVRIDTIPEFIKKVKSKYPTKDTTNKLPAAPKVVDMEVNVTPEQLKGQIAQIDVKLKNNKKELSQLSKSHAFGNSDRGRELNYRKTELEERKAELQKKIEKLSKPSSLPETPKAVEGGKEKTATEPSQSIPIVKKYAELMAEKQIKSELEGAKERNIEVTKEKIAEATEKTIAQNENQFNKLKDSIDNKDLKKLQDSLHLGNKNWRKFFEEYTGVKLGNTMRETKEALKDFVETGTHSSGPKAEDFYIINVDAEDKGNRTFVKVSGKPVTLKYKGDYFISKPPGSKEFVLSEARTGTAVGRGATKEEAIKAAEHDIEVYGGQKTIDKNIENLISKYGVSPRYKQTPTADEVSKANEQFDAQLKNKIIDKTKELRQAEEDLKKIDKDKVFDTKRAMAQEYVDELKDGIFKMEKAYADILKMKTNGAAETPAPSKTESIEHFRIGKSPQLYTKVRELPFNAKTDAEGEKYFEVKNETTGEVSTVEASDLKKVNTRTEEQKAIDSKKATENKIKKLEKQLETETDRFEKVRIQKKITEIGKKLEVIEKQEEVIKPITTENEAEIAEKIPEVPVDKTEDSSEDLSAEQQAEGEETANKLQDFGEKIGGARKDTDTGKRSITKSMDTRPAWAKKYEVFTAKDGTYEIAIVSGPFYKTVGKDFKTEQIALDAIPLYEVARNHRVYQKGEDNFAVYRVFSNHKMWDIKEGFKTRQEAMKYMALNAEELINAKSPIIERPHLDSIERRGKDYLKGKNATPEMFLNDFGFRGGEFGNWLAADERQKVLNLAYEAFMDLSEALQIPPSTLSLGGQLSIGFGSRGQGLSKASAHYERQRAVINLTKIKGAGSLAHEWFHAFDHYLGMQDGKANSIRNDKGTFDSKSPDKDYFSYGYQYRKSGVRKELTDAFQAVLKAVETKEVERTIDIEASQKSVESRKETLQESITKLRNWIAKDREYGNKKAAATTEQLKEFDKIADKMLSGEIGEDKWIVSPQARSRFSGKWQHETETQLSEIYKKVTGKGINEYNSVRSALLRYKTALDSLKEAEAGKTRMSTVSTDYVKAAKGMDSSRASAYWSSRHELMARAFESFVEDKILEKGLSQYLVHSTNNMFYDLFGVKPYPEGQERVNLNQAFQKLFDAIQTKTDESGKKVLYSLADKSERDKIVSSAKKDGTYLKAPNGKDTNLNAGQWVTVRTENFKKWFGNWDNSPETASKVVDENGEPLVVYSGHFNAEMYGEKYNPSKTLAGGFYSSESPEIASGYALGKANGNISSNGEQYRLAGKNGQLNKKLWQYELSDEQKKKIDELKEITDKYGEHEYGIHQMEDWIEKNKNYSADARRMSYNGGLYNLQNIYDYNEYMGYNIAYDNNRDNDKNLQTFQKQTKNETELIMDALGINWNSQDWSQPAVYPLFLNIRQPLDAAETFPEELLKALKDKAKYEREENDEYWTQQYSLKAWVKDIEKADEFWTTQIPKKALPIIKSFGYDGIKELGNKGAETREERQLNWIAFNANQIKSSSANKGTFDPAKDNIRYSLQDIKSDANVAGMDVLVTKLNKAFPGTEVVFATNKQVLEHLNDKYGTKLSIGEDAPLGFLDTDGKIYINTDRATMNTPIHEFSHILGEWIEQNKPGLYEQGIKLMRKDAALVREIEDKYGDVYNGSKKMINAEIFAKSVGDRAEKMYSEMPDGPEKQKLIDRFKEWLKKIINRFAQAFSGLRGEPVTKREKAQQLAIDKLTPDSTLEEYLNATGKDLLGGKTIADTRNDVQEAAKYSVGDNVMSEVINGFYSPIEKRLNEFKQEKVSANKWLTIIGKGDEGADKIAWTTGEQQGEQYKESLRQQVSKIFYAPSTEGKYIVDVYGIDNKVIKKIPQQLALPEIEKLLGKDIAAKIANSEGIPDENLDGKVLNTKDLTVGDHGMRDFYGSPKDNNLGIIGKVAESMFGKGSVKTTSIDTHDKNGQTVLEFGEWLYKKNKIPNKTYPATLDYAKKFYGDETNVFFKEFLQKHLQEQHSVNITPAMRSEVKRGLPLFQLGDKKNTEINIEAWKKFGAAVFNKHGELNKGEFKARLLRTINEVLIKRGDSPLEELPLTDAQVQKVFNAGKEYYKQILEGQKEKPLSIEKESVKNEGKSVQPKETKKQEDTAEPVKKVSEKVSNKLEERRFARQVLDSPDVAKEVKDLLTEDKTKYAPKSNKQTYAEALAMIEKEGVNGAIDEIMDKNSEYPFEVRIAAGHALIKTISAEATKIQKEGNTEEADKLFNKASEIAAIEAGYGDAQLGTALGRGVQAYSMFKRTTPEGALYMANKLKQREEKVKTDKFKKRAKGIKKDFDDVNKKTAEDVVKDENIKKKLDAAEKLAKKVADATKNEPAKEVDPITYMVKTLFEVVKEKKLVPEFPKNDKESLMELIGKAVRNEPGYEKVWNEAKEIVKKNFWDNVEALQVLDKYFEERFENPFSEKQIEKAVKEGIKETGINLTELVKQHYTVVDAARTSLKDKLVSKTGLSEAEALSLADAIQVKFDELATERKKKMLDSRFTVTEREKGVKKLYEKLIELTNMGALSDAGYWEPFREYLNIGPLDAKNTAKILELANKVQETPEGWQQDRAITDLYTYIQTMNGVRTTEVIKNIYYASLLSGVTTSGKNIVYNALNGAFELLNRNPMEYPAVFSKFLKDIWMGLEDYKSIWSEGYGQDIEKVAKFGHTSNIQVFDQYNFKGGKFNPANYTKYVMRNLIGQDGFFYRGLYEAEKRGMAYSIARREGLKGKDLTARIEELLNNSADKVADAKRTAELEGLKGVNLKRRVYEILDQGADEEIRTDADNFAARGTLNYPPRGTAGAIARAIQNLQKLPGVGNVVTGIVPFTNIVANVFNNNLDFTPYGYKRAFFGYFGDGDKNKWSNPMEGREFKRQLGRATIGTLGTLFVASLLFNWFGNNDDDSFDMTATGTGNIDRNNQLRKSGWRPYSVKIGGRWYPYLNTPIAPWFSLLGFLKDAIKYRKDYDEMSFMDKFGNGLVLTLSSLAEQSFVGGLKDFISVFDENREKGAEKYFQRFTAGIVGALVAPNIVKQIARIFDDQQYEANTWTEMVIRNVGIAQERFGLKPKLNILGEPIKKDGLMSSVISGVPVESSPIWDFIVKNSAFVSVPSKNTIIYDTEMQKQRSLTPDEYYEYVKKSGAKIKNVMEKNMDELNKMDSDAARLFVQKLTADARENTREEMFAPKTNDSINAYDFDAKFNMDKIMVNLKIDKYDLRTVEGKSLNYVPNKTEFQTGKIDTAHVQKSLLTHVVNLKQAVTDNKISKEYANKELEKANKLLKELNFTEVELLK